MKKNNLRDKKEVNIFVQFLIIVRCLHELVFVEKLTPYFPTEHTGCPHTVGRFEGNVMHYEISPRKFVAICRII